MTDEAAAELVHELKTPLAVIRGFAELLASRADDETRQAASTEILAAAARLSETIDALFGSSSDRGTAIEPPLGRATRARILLVDDDVFVRRLLRLTLSTESYEIAEAGDGEIALQLLAAQQPDLVILDWRIPTTPGAEVLAATKDARPQLPVIVLTADATQRRHAERADAFLTKPFSPLELINLIEDLLAATPPRPPRAESGPDIQQNAQPVRAD